jgi:hypothetical protein
VKHASEALPGGPVGRRVVLWLSPARETTRMMPRLPCRARRTFYMRAPRHPTGPLETHARRGLDSAAFWLIAECAEP